MKHDRRQTPREAVDLNNIDDDAQGTAPQEQNRLRIALGHTAAGVLLRWLSCLFLFCILCLALLFLPVAEGFVQLLQALAAFPAMLPLLRDAGIGFVYLTAILAGCGVAGKLFCRLWKSHCLDRLLDGLIAILRFLDIHSIDKNEQFPEPDKGKPTPKPAAPPEEKDAIPSDLNGLLDDLFKAAPSAQPQAADEPPTRIQKGA